MKELALLTVIAMPVPGCWAKKYNAYVTCMMNLGTFCIAPHSRPGIDVVLKFEPQEDDDCFEIYIVSTTVVATRYGGK